MIRSREYSKATFLVLLLVVASWSAHQSALAQPAGEKAVDENPKLVGLQEMLAIALRHNPDVRAAAAELRSVEAQLDRTRLEVVRKIIAFRKTWQTQRFAIRAAERELQQGKAKQVLAEAGVIPRGHQASLFAAAKEKLAFEQAKLAEIEAELPFLLGHTSGKAAPEADDKSRKLIREELLPKARQILELRTRAFQAGSASILEVASAHRQVTELETRLATTNKMKIAAVESQKKLLQSIRAMIEEAYKAGQATQVDVLAIELELSELDLRLLELKDDWLD